MTGSSSSLRSLFRTAVNRCFVQPLSTLISASRRHLLISPEPTAVSLFTKVHHPKLLNKSNFPSLSSQTIQHLQDGTIDSCSPYHVAPSPSTQQVHDLMNLDIRKRSIYVGGREVRLESPIIMIDGHIIYVAYIGRYYGLPPYIAVSFNIQNQRCTVLPFLITDDPVEEYEFAIVECGKALCMMRFYKASKVLTFWVFHGGAWHKLHELSTVKTHFDWPCRVQKSELFGQRLLAATMHGGLYANYSNTTEVIEYLQIDLHCLYRSQDISLYLPLDCDGHGGSF